MLWNQRHIVDMQSLPAWLLLLVRWVEQCCSVRDHRLCCQVFACTRTGLESSGYTGMSGRTPQRACPCHKWLSATGCSNFCAPAGSRNVRKTHADAEAKARLILHWLSSSQRRMPRHKVAAVEELGDFHDDFGASIGPD